MKINKIQPSITISIKLNLYLVKNINDAIDIKYIKIDIKNNFTAFIFPLLNILQFISKSKIAIPPIETKPINPKFSLENEIEIIGNNINKIPLNIALLSLYLYFP